MDQELLRYLKVLARLAIGVLGLVGVYLLFTYIFPIFGSLLRGIPKYFLPFVFALLLALLIEPAIRFLEQRFKISRGIATLASMLVVLGALGTGLVYLFSRLVSELISLYELLSIHSEDMSAFLIEGLEKAQLFYLQLNLPAELESTMQSNLARLFKGIEGIANSLANSLISIMADVPGFFIFILIAVIATYFMAKGRPEIREWFIRSLPESWEGKTRSVASDLISAFTGFMKALTILVSFTALQTIIGLKILGVEYAVTLGLLTGLLDIMPILGPGSLFLPWIIFSFVTGKVAFALGLLALYVFITTVRYMLEPRIIGQKVGLHPLATLISLYVGLKVAGVAGMFLGPIVVILFQACSRAGVFDSWSWWKKTQ